MSNLTNLTDGITESLELLLKSAGIWHDDECTKHVKVALLSIQHVEVTYQKINVCLLSLKKGNV